MNDNTESHQDPLESPAAISTNEEEEKIIELLNKRQTVDMNAEDMDPLEWAFRKIVPIPEHYYWDIVSSNEIIHIPARIRVWHGGIYALSRVSQWSADHIGQPLVRTLGLDTPRMHDVTMFMSEKDWKQSQRIVTERQNQTMDLSKNNETSELTT